MSLNLNANTIFNLLIMGILAASIMMSFRKRSWTILPFLIIFLLLKLERVLFKSADSIVSALGMNWIMWSLVVSMLLLRYLRDNALTLDTRLYACYSIALIPAQISAVDIELLLSIFNICAAVALLAITATKLTTQKYAPAVFIALLIFVYSESAWELYEYKNHPASLVGINAQISLLWDITHTMIFVVMYRMISNQKTT